MSGTKPSGNTSPTRVRPNAQSRGSRARPSSNQPPADTNTKVDEQDGTTPVHVHLPDDGAEQKQKGNSQDADLIAGLLSAMLPASPKAFDAPSAKSQPPLPKSKEIISQPEKEIISQPEEDLNLEIKKSENNDHHPIAGLLFSSEPAATVPEESPAHTAAETPTAPIPFGQAHSQPTQPSDGADAVTLPHKDSSTPPRARTQLGSPVLSRTQSAAASSNRYAFTGSSPRTEIRDERLLTPMEARRCTRVQQIPLKQTQTLV